MRSELQKLANNTDMDLANLAYRAERMSVQDTRGDALRRAINSARTIARSMMHPDDVKAAPN